MKIFLQSKTFLLYCSLMLFVHSSYAQDYDKYLQVSKKQFAAGDYAAAQRSLNVYEQISNTTEPQLRDEMSKCIALLSSAADAKDIQSYDQAKVYYEDILKYNPVDLKVKVEIDKMEKIISQKETSKSGDYKQSSKMASTQFALGNNYYFGRNGVTQSYTEAVKCYRKAAEQKHSLVSQGSRARTC